MYSASVRGRTFRARSATPIAEVPSERPHTWSGETMKIAYSAVKSEELSIREASERYGIPYTTLLDRVNGRVKFGSHSGPTRYLNDSEEVELVTFLAGAASMGFARSKKEVICIVEAVLNAKGNPKHVSNGWWESFLRRHPQLCLRKAEKLSYARLKATDPVVMERYFDLLERTLEEYELFDAPSRIFNCDETGMCYEHKPPAVVAVKGQHHPRAVTTGNKRQVTVLACANAAGYHMPPLVVMKRKTLPIAILKDEVAGTAYSLSESGWMDSETFDFWFENHFLIHAPPARPLLLLLDGHSSHYNPQFITRAANEKIIVFCLPPNTTHLAQPLDKGIFGPLKTYWNEECHVYLRSHPGQVMNDYSFNTVFAKAWGRAMTIPNAASAFRTTGVYPFDRTAVKTADPVGPLNDLHQSSGLHYIPLLSPAPARRKSQVLSRASGIDELPLINGSMAEVNGIPSEGETDSSESQEQSRASGVLQPNNLLLNDVPKTQSLISRFYPSFRPEIKLPKSSEKSSGKVLTGAEYRREMEKKEKEKEEKKRLAAERKTLRALKQAAKKRPPTRAKCSHKSTTDDADPESGHEQTNDNRDENTPTFTQEEFRKFTHRLEEGYDLKNDKRYNLWLETYFPSRFLTESKKTFVGEECAVRTQRPNTDEAIVIFTDNEWELFETRLEEGYDIKPTGRYLRWLQMYHPDLISQETEEDSDTEVEAGVSVSLPGMSTKTATKGSTRAPKSPDGGVSESKAGTGTKVARAATKGSTRAPKCPSGGVSESKAGTGTKVTRAATKGVSESKPGTGTKATRAATKDARCVSMSGPGTSTETTCTKAASLEVKSLCITRRCGNAWDEDWVCCDRCSVWLHCRCAGVSLELVQDPSYEFICCN